MMGCTRRHGHKHCLSDCPVTHTIIVPLPFRLRKGRATPPSLPGHSRRYGVRVSTARNVNSTGSTGGGSGTPETATIQRGLGPHNAGAIRQGRRHVQPRRGTVRAFRGVPRTGQGRNVETQKRRNAEMGTRRGVGSVGSGAPGGTEKSSPHKGSCTLLSRRFCRR